MAEDNMQLQRWELKYLVSEELAMAAREFLRSYLELDGFGAKRTDLSYTIHNLYLDSEDLTLYRDTVNGTKNRYKLRLRFYEDNPAAPVFFEIKRRMNDAILKQRGGVKRAAVKAVLAGQLPASEELVSGDLRQLAAVQRFVQRAAETRAVPVAHVAYEREAWISPTDNSVRVTFDRRVRIAPEFAARFTADMDHPVAVFDPLVVLELKFTGRFPDWFRELVRVFNLMQESASKYADGISRRGERDFYPRPQAAFGRAAASANGRRRIQPVKLDKLLVKSV